MAERGNGHVLVVSTARDAATDAVIHELVPLGPRVTRIDSEDLPFAAAISLELPAAGSELRLAYRRRDLPNGALAPITACWYRRVRVPPSPHSMDPGIYDFCLHESRATLIGGILGLGATFMNHPSAVWAAEFKPYQLAVASRLGLRIPRTVVSNDAAAVREAIQDFGDAIAKPVRTGYAEPISGPRSIYTTRITARDVQDPEAIGMSPVIYQELVPKRRDIRVTIVGDTVFSAAIDSQSDSAAEIDWRRTSNPDLPHSAVDLPTGLREGLLRLMRHLRLDFGAVDLIETTSGDYVFLEVNPGGQWLWLEDRLMFPISKAIAAWLAKAATRVQ